MEGKDEPGNVTASDIASLPVTEKKKADKEKKAKDREDRENERLKARAYENEQTIKRLEAQLATALEEKRKPGIAVVDEEGEYTKRKRINSSGLSDLILPPYTKNQVAIYKIIGTEEINPATGLKVDPVDTLIPGRYTLHDRFEPDPLKKDKVMQNISGTENYVEDGQAKTRQLIEDIVFIRGWLQVPVKDKFPLYVFMELHPMNKSNRFRPSNAVIAFERVDIQHRSPVAINMSTELALDAGNAVRKMSKDQVLSYCMTTVPPIMTAGRNVDEVRGDLIRYAMNNPIPFFKQNKDMKAAIAITVADAISFGIIEYRLQQKSYVNSETDEVIFTHSIQEEPMEAFIKYLTKEEQKDVYDNIVTRMNYWSNE